MAQSSIGALLAKVRRAEVQRIDQKQEERRRAERLGRRHARRDFPEILAEVKKLLRKMELGFQRQFLPPKAIHESNHEGEFAGGYRAGLQELFNEQDKAFEVEIIYPAHYRGRGAYPYLQVRW